MSKASPVIAVLLFCLALLCAPAASAETVCTVDPNGVEGGAQSDITQICFNELNEMAIVFLDGHLVAWKGVVEFRKRTYPSIVASRSLT